MVQSKPWMFNTDKVLLQHMLVGFTAGSSAILNHCGTFALAVYLARMHRNTWQI